MLSAWFAAVPVSSPASCRQTLISIQRTPFHYRGTLLHVDERFAWLLVAERNTFVMLAARHHLMVSYRWRVSGNEFSAATHLHIAALLANPDFLPGIAPRNRIAAAPPGNIGIPRYLALLVISVRVRQTAVHRLHTELIFIPANQHLFPSRSVHALVGDFRYPTP